MNLQETMRIQLNDIPVSPPCEYLYMHSLVLYPWDEEPEMYPWDEEPGIVKFTG